MIDAIRAPTFGMAQRSDHPDFYIRDQSARPATATPHRHEYFQMQLNLGGDTVHHIGGAVRPFKRHTLAFILPHRLHVIPHPDDGHFVLINFTQSFLIPHIKCDAMDLEDVSVDDVPELAPFCFQEYLDFVLPDSEMPDVMALIERMRSFDALRQAGSALILKGCLLQLIGIVYRHYQSHIAGLCAEKAERRGRRDALARVSKYIREHIDNPAMTLKDVAAAAFLSPNYLTHMLRKETGNTFSDLVLERRMRLARTYLINTLRPVGQIAQLCGFADEAYFSRRFRRAHGIPPGQFRRQHQVSG